ncbi:branched-chain amino acid ABC transporter permease [Amorphus orientalis]|uniref:Branched-chain amino acid transport system permease protein n=1 Tax=Amorphus orientalis TaxID=649198 RepID=A0AAE4AU29_9HYPH|nr:branched-chain amino acid ABC transporter permease [Amorphus orientalis]MDQ0316875.1 branched-chain amino acid transport system permease protein [Amorphus orientalis]
MSGYWAGILSLLAINIVFAYGIFLPVATGQLNLGGAGFYAIGAYSAAYLSFQYDMPLVVTVAAGFVLAGVIGFLIAFPILRTRGVYLVLATFAFAEVVGGLILNSETLGGAMGLPVPTYVDYEVPIAAAVIVTLIVFYIMSTRFGLVMRAVHDDEVVSDLMGVNIRGVQVTAFAIGAAFAGLAGVLYAHTYTYVEIQGFNALMSIYVLLYVLLGGTQTAWGPLAGAAFFTLLPEVFRAVVPAANAFIASLIGYEGVVSPPDASWRFVILGVFTVLMMVFRPEGMITRTMIERLRLRRAPDSASREATV